MITLENIKLDEHKDMIVIDFSYEGNGINIDKAQIKLDKDRWIQYKLMNVPDTEMIQHLLEGELKHLAYGELEDVPW